MINSSSFRRVLPALLLLCTLAATGQRSEGSNELPVIIDRPNGSYSLLVDGKPFIILGDPAL